MASEEFTAPPVRCNERGYTVTQSAPDVMQAVKQEAHQYLGDVSNMSDDQIRNKIRNLAKNQPDTARRMIDAVCSQIDRSTGGRFSGQLDQLQEMVINKIGVDRSMLAAQGGGSGQGGGQRGRPGGQSGNQRARGPAGRSPDQQNGGSPRSWGR